MKLSDQPFINEFQAARFHFAHQLVTQTFGDSAFLTPVEFGKNVLGWSESTIYKYSAGISGRRFPIALRKIGGTQMVSALDYLEFLLQSNRLPDPASAGAGTPQPKKRGRRSNEERARLAAEQQQSAVSKNH